MCMILCEKGKSCARRHFVQNTCREISHVIYGTEEVDSSAAAAAAATAAIPVATVIQAVAHGVPRAENIS